VKLLFSSNLSRQQTTTPNAKADIPSNQWKSGGAVTGFHPLLIKLMKGSTSLARVNKKRDSTS